ncbi:MAG: hypothetical protein J3Q66DRAFT_440390 [Benniella sp.]|nr:MAG: hypothetical protein J3Q66DRAFT_440390 [Benniella sp.]
MPPKRPVETAQSVDQDSREDARGVRPAPRGHTSEEADDEPSDVRLPMVDTVFANTIDMAWRLGEPLEVPRRWPSMRLPLDLLMREPVAFKMEPSEVEWEVARRGKAAVEATLRQLDWSRVYWAANAAQFLYNRHCMGDMTAGEVGTHVTHENEGGQLRLNHDVHVRESVDALDRCTRAKETLEKLKAVFQEVLDRDGQYGASGVTTATHPRKRKRDEDQEGKSSMGRMSPRAGKRSKK